MPAAPGSVSAEAALSRGWLWVQLPSMLLFAAPLLVFALGAAPQDHYGSRGFRLFLLAASTGLALSWLWWALAVPRWRLWAWRRVEDIELLKEIAVEAKLLWPEGHPLQRSEIMLPGWRRELESLEQGAWQAQLERLRREDEERP